jgi:hypothetical protein
LGFGCIVKSGFSNVQACDGEFCVRPGRKDPLRKHIITDSFGSIPDNWSAGTKGYAFPGESPAIGKSPGRKSCCARRTTKGLRTKRASPFGLTTAWDIHFFSSSLCRSSSESIAQPKKALHFRG